MKHIIMEKDTIETLNIKIGITIFINSLMEDETEVLTPINNLIIKDGMDTEVTIEKIHMENGIEVQIIIKNLLIQEGKFVKYVRRVTRYGNVVSIIMDKKWEKYYNV